jgi:hypothetical protein
LLGFHVAHNTDSAVEPTAIPAISMAVVGLSISKLARVLLAKPAIPNIPQINNKAVKLTTTDIKLYSTTWGISTCPRD